MAKATGIRWKPGEKEEITREIRRYNERRRRAIKKNPDLINTIPTMPPKQTVAKITTRKELKNLQAEIKLSGKKNAFELVKVGDIKVTRYELAVQKRRLKQLNLQRAAKRRKANVSTEKGTMGTIQQNSLLPKKLSKPKSRTEWEKFVQSVEKQIATGYDSAKDVLYRGNYYAAFLETYGLANATELMEMLEKLTAEEIVDAMYKNPILNIEFLYNEREEWESEHYEDVIEAWKNYLKSIGK